MIKLLEKTQNRETYGGCKGDSERARRAINRHSQREYQLVVDGEPVPDCPLFYLDRVTDANPRYFQAFYAIEQGISPTLIVEGDQSEFGDNYPWKRAEALLENAVNRYFDNGKRTFAEAARAIRQEVLAANQRYLQDLQANSV